MRILRFSLHARAMFLVGGVTILLFSTLIYRHYQREETEYETLLTGRVQLQADFLAASIAQAMWDFNTSYIHSAAESVLQDNDIAAVEVLDTDGKTMDALLEKPAGDLKDKKYFIIHSAVRYNLAGKTQTLGTVNLTVSRENIRAQLHDYLKDTVLQAITFLLLQMLLLHTILRYLLRPVQSITRAMLGLAHGKTHTEIPSQQRQDEIGQMARAIQVFKNTAVRVDELMSEVEARRELQRELELAKEQAEASTMAQSQFLANMSHEIRTPMNGILGMAHLMLDTDPSPVQKEYIATITHSANNLLLLLNDILDLSKIEAQELILESTSFDIGHNFTQAIKLFKPMAQSKKIELLWHIDAETPAMVTGDPGRFGQIVTNLIGNAVKFTERGKVEAFLRYEKALGHIYCRINDTGIGIPEDKQSLIFKKFTQGDASITRKYGGTGLGLAITRQLVEMMGGHIGFNSTVGQGTHFWFSLPVALASEADEDQESLCPVNALRVQASAARVLIAEDHPVNQTVLKKLLEKIGFTSIDIAENGVKALEKWRDGSYHVIFMDCQMPEKDGYETTIAIRQQERESGKGEHVLTIAMTASAMSGDRDACFKAGMDDYISKPLDPEYLKTILGRRFILKVTNDPVVAGARHDATNPPVDMQHLRMIAGDEETRQDLLRMFFRSAEEKLAIMERARRHSEAAEWKNAAHYLKGAAANLGLKPFSQLCGHAERGGPFAYTEATTLLHNLRAEVTRIRVYLDSA